MSYQIYDVTLTDLGTYTVTVAAEDEGEALLIAKDVLYEEATQFPPGFVAVKRETDGTATLAAKQPTRRFNVGATYSLLMTIPNIPAPTPADAERHAERLYRLNEGPFDFEHNGDSTSAFKAREVTS